MKSDKKRIILQCVRLSVLPVLCIGLLVLSGCQTGTNFYDVQAAQYEAQGVIGAARENRLAEEARQKTEQYKLLTTADTGGTSVTNEDGYTVEVKNQNPYLYLTAFEGAGVSAAGSRQVQTAAMPAPIKVKSGWEKGLAVTLGFLDHLSGPLANVWMADIQRKGNTDIARLNMKATLGQAEYAYKEAASMHNTFAQVSGDAIAGMTEVSTTATNDMRDLGMATASEMKQVSTTYATEASKQIEDYTTNFQHNTYIGISETNTTNTSSHTSTVQPVDIAEIFEEVGRWPTYRVDDEPQE